MLFGSSRKCLWILIALSASAAYAEINSCASVMFLEMSHLLFHLKIKMQI